MTTVRDLEVVVANLEKRLSEIETWMTHEKKIAHVIARHLRAEDEVALAERRAK